MPFKHILVMNIMAVADLNNSCLDSMLRETSNRNQQTNNNILFINTIAKRYIQSLSSPGHRSWWFQNPCHKAIDIHFLSSKFHLLVFEQSAPTVSKLNYRCLSHSSAFSLNVMVFPSDRLSKTYLLVYKI